MAKDAKKRETGNPLARKLKQSASQIWLAGLGAYSKAEEEGNKLFDTLVKEGESAKNLLESLIDKPRAKYQETLGDMVERVEEVKDKAAGSWDRLEKAFDERVANTLHRLNIPTRQDVAELAQQVMQCKAELRQLQSGRSEKPITAAVKTKTASGVSKIASTKAATPKASTSKVLAGKSTTAKKLVSKKIAAKKPAVKQAEDKTTVKSPVKKTIKAVNKSD